MKRAVIRKSEKVVLLMDVQKVSITSTFTFAYLEDVNVIVSDSALGDQTLKEFEINNNIVY